MPVVRRRAPATVWVRRMADRVGVDAAALQRLQLGHRTRTCSGSRATALASAASALPSAATSGRAAVMGSRPAPRVADRRVMAGVLLVAPAERQTGSPRRSPRRRRRAGAAGVAVAGEARQPLRLVLHIGAVQGLQLPPPGEEQQQSAPQPRDRARAELGALLEGRAEHREVQRDPGHANALRPERQFGDHQLHGAVGGLRRAAHQVERDAVGAPRHQRQHRDHAVVAVRSASTSRQSPSAGSPSRPSAMEKPRSVSVSRQASARDVTCAISSAAMSRWRRTRTVSPAREPASRPDGPAHVAAARSNLRGQDRLVAELVAPSPPRGAWRRAARAHHGGAQPRRHAQPGVDAPRPRAGSPTGSPLARHTPTSTR